MTFRVAFGGGAAIQFHSLPAAGQNALVARAAELAEAPWDAAVLPPGDDPAFRIALFDDGRGLMSFHVDEPGKTIRIFNLVWVA